MRVDLYGLTFETPEVTVYLWSPWRAAHLEHRLFEAVSSGLKVEQGPDERHVHIRDPKTWKTVVQAMARVLKGWQEDGGHEERRIWRWLLEADVDCNGYDHAGEPASMWLLVRVGIDRGGPGEAKGEDLDMEGFCLRVWGVQEG
ncbi:MAG: hypothetical protein AB7K24_03485 [Gemmataceae bacterium]